MQRLSSRCRSLAFLALVAFLIVAQASCSDSAAPDGPTGWPPANTSVILAATSPTSLTAMVGSAVEETPRVITTTADGTPIAGIRVAFVVKRGGGYVSGETATSNAAGVAALGRWTLGILPDTNVVEAQVSGLPSVVFTAKAVKGPPALLTKIAGDDQYLSPGAQVAALPMVAVTDIYANPISGWTVTFKAANPEDEILGASVVTDHSGIATLASWKVGGIGSHKVVASGDMLVPAVFTAIVLDEALKPCSVEGALPAGQSISGQLGSGGCRTAAGRYFDTYSFTAIPGFQSISVESSAFDTYLEIFSADGAPIARNDNTGGSTTNSALRVFLPDGSFKLSVASLSAATGAYQIRQGPLPVVERPCEPIFVVRGAAFSGQLSSSNCSGVPATHQFRIYLAEGSTIEADLLDWTYSNWYLDLRTSSGLVVSQGQWVGSYHYVLNYRVTESGYYTIKVDSSDDLAEYSILIK